MHSQTNERIQKIRSEVLTEKAAVSELKTLLADNTDKYVNQLLQLASYWLDDVDVLYLGILKDARTPPRSVAEESKVVDSAEFFLKRVAIPQLRAIQNMVATYGVGVRIIG